MKINNQSDRVFSRRETLSLNSKNNSAGYFGDRRLVSTYGQTVEFADCRENRPDDGIMRADGSLYRCLKRYFLKPFICERQTRGRVFVDDIGKTEDFCVERGVYHASFFIDAPIKRAQLNGLLKVGIIK